MELSFCPHCGEKGLQYPDNRYWKCESCGLMLYNNVASATGVLFFCVNEDKSRTLLVESRAKDPGKGKLGLPGGFTDPDETAEACCIRECREEIGITITEEKLQYLTSCPNTYEFKGIVYKTCDIYFLCEVTQFEMFRLQRAAKKQVSEVSDLSTIVIDKNTSIDDLPLAFSSAVQALKKWQKTF